MSGPKGYDDLPMNWVGDWAGRRAALTPKRPALHDVGSDERFTFEELNERANRAGAWLVDGLGLKKGDRIAFIARNRVEMVDLYLACGKTGIVLAPLSYRLAPRELNDLLRRIQPKAFFCEDVFASLGEKLEYPASVKTRIDVSDGDCAYRREVLAHAPREVNVPLAMSDPFLFIHTGGTTATPKVCVIPHRQMVWNAVDLLATSGNLFDSRYLVTFPFFHVGGWNSFMGLFYAAGYSVMLRQFDPKQVLGLIESERITNFGGVEAMLQFMIAQPEFAKTDLSSLKGISTAGAPCAAPVMKAFIDRGVPVSQAYGLTEAGPSNFAYAGHGASLDEFTEHTASIGTSMFHCDYQIVDKETKQPVPRGEPGVLCLRSPHNFQEYLDQPERTDGVFLDGGWVYSGDLAKESEDGTVAIVGRADNMFISGGENVSPEEIENVLNEHPAVKGAVVLAVPDEKWGQLALGVVVAPESETTREELFALCKQHLARFKVPRRIEFVEAIPLTGAGKIDRNALKERFAPAKG